MGLRLSFCGSDNLMLRRHFLPIKKTHDESLSRHYLIGFSHPKARHFLLLRLGNCSCIALPPASMQSKRKCPKKRRPDCRFILCFSVLSGVGKRGFLPFMPFGCFTDARHPCRAPLCPAGIRAYPDKTCDARRGKREKNNVTA